MKNKALRFLDSLINDETTKYELDIIHYLKGLTKADNAIKKINENEPYIKELFDMFYKIYARKGGKEQAYKTWRKKLIKIKDREEILEKARKIARMYRWHCKEWETNNTSKQYIPYCSSWLNSNIPD